MRIIFAGHSLSPELRCVMLGCFLVQGVSAGSLCAVSAPGDPRHTVQFLAGYSPDSPTWLGSTPDRRFVMAGLTYEYRCSKWPPASVSFTTGIMPAAVLLQPATPSRPAHPVYGFAVLPVGVLAEFARARTVHPFAEWMGGVIGSTEPIPYRAPNATGLNFIFDLGGGLEWRITPRSGLRVGYKFLHISNAATTSFNPGVDNHLLYVGYVLRR